MLENGPGGRGGLQNTEAFDNHQVVVKRGFLWQEIFWEAAQSLTTMAALLLSLLSWVFVQYSFSQRRSSSQAWTPPPPPPTP